VYIIISNYYTPDDPNGDASVYADAGLLTTDGQTFSLNGQQSPQGLSN
jgi:hypothetical protein